MSSARIVDDLARSLAQPLSRRRALRLLATSAAALAVPALRPPTAPAAVHRSRASDCRGDTRACPTRLSGASGPDKCCGSPALRYGCEGALEDPVCVDLCPRPHTVCPTGGKDENGNTKLVCCKAPRTVGCCEGECIPNCQLLFGPGHTPCCASCCPPGRRCAFSGKSRTCCPTNRTVNRKIQGKPTRFCCPAGTVRVRGASCCPPDRRDCCDDLLAPPGGDDGQEELVPLDPFVGRTFCVNGRKRRL